MTNLNLENYFTNQTNYNPKIIIDIIEDIIGKPFNQIKEDINKQKVTITEEQIKKYLEEKFIEENPELKKRIDSYHQQKYSYNPNWQEEEQNLESIRQCQRSIDNIIATKYDFDPDTLEYFIKYTTIIKRKLILLLKIIEGINNKNIKSIQDTLTDLDINIDAKGNISKDDIIRLIHPTIYNIQELDEKIARANNLSTYLTFTIRKTSYYEGYIYPSQSLQIKSLFHDHISGNVPLSKKQREELLEKQRKSMHACIKALLK